ncbi:MAG: NAD synthetase [Rhizobiales bacterium 65-9]|nr:ABC transporter permease [Hyphomicrobiales bacterium]OJY37923.1 MAG: NAD synthetase [Rhizobiales bacterium 65-9]
MSLAEKAPPLAGGRAASDSIWALRWKRFRQHRGGVASLVVLALLAAFCLAAGPLETLRGVDAVQTDLFKRYEPPSAEHWLGTDDAGRDELARLMRGGQISLLVGLLATVIGGVFGVTLGLLAGYFGGRLDSALMRFTDGMIALPLLPLLIVLGAIDLTKLGFSPDTAHSPSMSFWRIIVIIALVDWTAIARLVRASTLSVKEREFVLASRAGGAGHLHIMAAHILPNIITPIIVAFTLTVGRVILFESVLSFLGFGVTPPTPSWGNMLNNAQELVTVAPALAIYPGLLIFITVIAVNFLGDAMQHAFDPRSEE